MSFSIVFGFFLFFLVPEAYSDTKQKENPLADKKPLVLQWEVSHFRNTDQISLIFRQDTVELVTNTSRYQKNKPVRLGWFESPMNSEFEQIKRQISLYYTSLNKTIPLIQLIPIPKFIKGLNVQATVIPHAPVLRIGEKKVHRKHPYFQPMVDIIHQAWKWKWLCMECAVYKKRGRFILRTEKKLQTNLKTQKTDQKKIKKQWKEVKRSFAKKMLNCLPMGNNKVECVDPQFGIFEI